MSEQINYLKQLYETSRNLSNKDHESCQSLRVSAYSTLISMFGENSIYVKQLDGFMKGYAGAFLSDIRAILKSVLQDIENGALINYEQKIIVGAFENFLEQAKKLNQGGDEGKKPAGVLVSAVFEDLLSRICIINGETPPNKPQSKIDLLRTKGIIDTIVSSRFETIKELRNKAFHAKWDEFTNQDVGRSINELEDLM